MRITEETAKKLEGIETIVPTYEEAIAEILFHGCIGNDRQYLYDYVHGWALENSLYLKMFCNGWEEEFNDN